VKSEQVRVAVVDALVAFSEMKFSAYSMDNFKQQILKSPDLLGELFLIEDERRDGVEPGYRDVASAATKRAVIGALAWLSTVDANAPAAAVLTELCERVQLAATARRIFVRAYDASVINKSIASLLAAAAASGQSLREFWNAVNAREAFIRRKRDRKSVLIECAGNAKGKEFEHVILPFMEEGEFPSQLTRGPEEENLFYVAATRAKARLTLVSPTEIAARSSFIAQMRLPKSSAAAEGALERNQRAPVATASVRHYLTAGFHDKDQVKALGAKFDIARRAWYVESDTDLTPFLSWMKK